jgi:hypothetical protein
METGKRMSKIEARNVYISGRGLVCVKFDGGGRKRSSLSFLILREGDPLYCNGLIKGSPWVIKLLTAVSENRNLYLRKSILYGQGQLIEGMPKKHTLMYTLLQSKTDRNQQNTTFFRKFKNRTGSHYPNEG